MSIIVKFNNMTVSQRTIKKLSLIILLCIVFFFALFFSIKSLPPIPLSISPTIIKQGEIVRISGIALSNSTVPTKIFINDVLVAQEDIIEQGFFSISFRASIESGATYVYLKQGDTVTEKKLLIIRSLNKEFEFSQKTAVTTGSELEITYLSTAVNSFIDQEDDARTIFSHPLQELHFEVGNSQISKNLCSITVQSNVTSLKLPPHTWHIVDTKKLSIALPELQWFNYNSLSSTLLIFDCGTLTLTFPLELSSISTFAEDISAFYELSIEYPRTTNGASYLVPIQSRSQQRTAISDFTYDATLYNYLSLPNPSPVLTVGLTIIPLVLKNTDAIQFELNPHNVDIPAYLTVSESERKLLDTVSSPSIKATNTLLRSVRNNPSFLIQDLLSISTTLSGELRTVSDEDKHSYFDQHFNNMPYSDQNMLHLLFLARVLNCNGIVTRTVLGTIVQEIANEETITAKAPINISSELLVWLEFYSKDFGWIAIHNEYNLKARKKASNTTSSEAQEIVAAETIRIPKNVLRLYIFEEFLWLKKQRREPSVPIHIRFL